MTLKAIGAMLVVLVVVFIVGHTWFHIVEGVLSVLKRLFGKKETVAWHTLPAEQEEEERE